MKHRRFEQLVDNRLNSCNHVLCSKDKEYSTEDDRLHNFYAAARTLECSPPRALMGMLVKHWVSVQDIINTMDINPMYVPEKELVKDKLGDVINYMLLLEGLIEDRRNMMGEVDNND